MKRTIIMAVGLLALAGCERAGQAATGETRVLAASDIEAGRYLVLVGGCNDCHTPGYVQGGGRTPEAEWLKGNPLGFHGPWGTTYAHNLRLTTAGMSEDDWVEMLNTREALPPMPWPSVRAMAEADQRAVYRYIRSLGAAGEAAPAALPPGQTPPPPYENMTIVTAAPPAH